MVKYAYGEQLKAKLIEGKVYNTHMKKSFSAGGVVLNTQNEVLVVSQHGDSWSLPKGHIDQGEDALTAALNARGIDHTTKDTTITKRNALEVAVVDAAAREQELERAYPPPRGVLRELALARWRGSATRL